MGKKPRLGADSLEWILGQNMPINLKPKQLVSVEELLMSQVAQQEALTRLLVEQGIFTEEEFLEMGRVVKLQMKRGWSGIVLKGFAE